MQSGQVNLGHALGMIRDYSGVGRFVSPDRSDHGVWSDYDTPVAVVAESNSSPNADTMESWPAVTEGGLAGALERRRTMAERATSGD